MSHIFFDVIFLALGFILLIRGADWIVTYASRLAKRYHVSDWMVGATVVAIGSALPECLVNLYAVTHGSPELALANVLGGVTANNLLILGSVAIVFPLAVSPKALRFDVPLVAWGLITVWVLAMYQARSSGALGLSWIGGLVLLGVFAVYVFRLMANSEGVEHGASTNGTSADKTPGASSFVMIGLGFVCLWIGAQWIVNHAIQLAKHWSVPESLIGFTVVAIGTSLPEWTASCVAAWKKNPSMAVGNVIGSNLINVFFILGMSSILRPMPIQASDIPNGAIALWSAFLIWLFPLISRDSTIHRRHGIALVLAYGFYMVYLIMGSI